MTRFTWHIHTFKTKCTMCAIHCHFSMCSLQQLFLFKFIITLILYWCVLGKASIRFTLSLFTRRKIFIAHD